MKKWIWIAIVMIFGGAAICYATAAAIHFDFGKLDNRKYENNFYSVDELFQNISVTASTEKVLLKPAEDNSCTVVCFEEEDSKHEVAVIDSTLMIKKTVEDHKRSLHFGISILSPEITVYLPENIYSDLYIESDTGDIDIPADFTFNSITINGNASNVTCLASSESETEVALSTGDISVSDAAAGSLNLRTTSGNINVASVKCEGDALVNVDTGIVKLRDLTCRNLTSEGSTGEITLDHVAASDTLSVIRNTGDVKFLESDGASIFVQTDTGNVTGTLLTEKVFLTETDTGKVEVPKSIIGGKCEISTDTGNIRIEVR